MVILTFINGKTHKQCSGMFNSFQEAVKYAALSVRVYGLDSSFILIDENKNRYVWPTVKEGK